MTICLSMIVKNEAHIILTTLKNICDTVPISYWVISDTGSTDATKETIHSFFKEKNIPGELVEHKWRDFAYNRSKALECAFNKTDYLMIFDADDSIVGKIKLPKWKEDKYMAKFGQNFSYARPLFVTNRKPWYYTGVLHEYLDAKEPRTSALLEGDYYIVSGRLGDRSKNANKYADDAKVLSDAFETEPDKALKTRYAFYCGQSYKDAKQEDKAIEWYEKNLTLNGWDQERYYSCLQLGEMYARKKDMEMAQFYWCKSCQYDPERIEGIVTLMEYLYSKGNHVLINAMYHKWKDYNRSPKDKLFIRLDLYEYHIEYYNSVSAFYARDFYSGYVCCKELILHGKDVGRVNSAINNLCFYKVHVKKDKHFMSILRKRDDVPEKVLTELNKN